MKQLVIIGAGSVGGHISLNPDLYGIEGKIVGFLDDDPTKQGKKLYGLKVLGGVDWINHKGEYDVIIGIAFPSIKRKIIEHLAQNTAIGFPSLVAKNAWISESCTIGKGVIIYPGCCINYGSVIQDFVVMNMNCALGHHSHVGEYSSLAPGVNFGGHTTVGSLVDIGIGTATIQNMKIGDEAIIGGQTMLIHDVPDGTTVVGNPGRVIKSK